jgi:hypothetical protein
MLLEHEIEDQRAREAIYRDERVTDDLVDARVSGKSAALPDEADLDLVVLFEIRGKAAEREFAAGKRKLSVLTLEIDEIELNNAFLQDIDTDDGLLSEAECRHICDR